MKYTIEFDVNRNTPEIENKLNEIRKLVLEIEQL